MEQIHPIYIEKLKKYYEKNADLLYRTVDKILLKFGGLYNKDKDYFYALASDLFADICVNDKYELSKGSFEGFFHTCLSNKIKNEITKRNCDKRKADRMSVSIDTPVGDEENSTIGDMIADKMDVERVIFGEESATSPKIEKYLESLTKRQRKVVEMLAESYRPGEIQIMLHISAKEYEDALSGIHSYENISLLF